MIIITIIIIGDNVMKNSKQLKNEKQWDLKIMYSKY